MFGIVELWCKRMSTYNLINMYIYPFPEMCRLTLKSRARYTVMLAPIPTDLCYAQLRAVIENVTIPEFTKERYLSRVAKARALVPLREKFAHFLFSSYLFFYFIFHLLCYISVSHKVCSFQWCQKFDMLHWEIKIGSQNGDSEWLCKSQPYLRVQNL